MLSETLKIERKQKSWRKKAPAAVWEAVFSLLTDLVSLRRDLQTRVEQEWEAHGDPVAQARAWAAKLAQLECKRDEY